MCVVTFVKNGLVIRLNNKQYKMSIDILTVGEIADLNMHENIKKDY